ncbi:MAG TPA: hypothetical protein VF384_18690 [Planctomycetota bacterium]
MHSQPASADPTTERTARLRDLLQRALNAAGAGDWTAALELVDGALALPPNAEVALVALADLAAKTRKEVVQVGVLLRGDCLRHILQPPGPMAVHVSAVGDSARADLVRRAGRHLEVARRFLAGNPDHLTSTAFVAAAVSQHDLAHLILKDALRLDPEHAPSLRMLEIMEYDDPGPTVSEGWLQRRGL